MNPGTKRETYGSTFTMPSRRELEFLESHFFQIASSFFCNRFGLAQKLPPEPCERSSTRTHNSAGRALASGFAGECRMDQKSRRLQSARARMEDARVQSKRSHCLLDVRSPRCVV